MLRVGPFGTNFRENFNQNTTIYIPRKCMSSARWQSYFLGLYVSIWQTVCIPRIDRAQIHKLQEHNLLISPIQICICHDQTNDQPSVQFCSRMKESINYGVWGHRKLMPPLRPLPPRRIHPPPRRWRPGTVGTQKPSRSCWTRLLWTPSHPYPRQYTNARKPCDGT